MNISISVIKQNKSPWCPLKYSVHCLTIGLEMFELGKKNKNNEHL